MRFLRVALKDLHHTREAMSTAKSIRALSVHKIARSIDTSTLNPPQKTRSTTLLRTSETMRIECGCDVATPKKWDEGMHISCLFLMGGGSGYLHSIIAPFSEAIWCLGSIILWSGRVNKSKKKNGAQKFPESRQFFWGGVLFLRRSRQTAPYLKPTLGDISPPREGLTNASNG